MVDAQKSADAYEALRAHPFVRELMQPAYGYYAVHFLCILLGFLMSAALFVIAPVWWVQLFNAVFLAFVLVQAGMFAHDLAHGQVFRDPLWDSIIGATVWGLFCGVSQTHWYAHHNAHHVHPNRIGHDPDMELPFYFDERELERAPRFARRFIAPMQHLLFYPLIGVSYVLLTLRGYWRLVRTPSLLGAYEAILIALHFAVLAYFLITYLAPAAIIAFLFVHILAVGLYMGLVFAPNHKGMPVFSGDDALGWKEQVRATRNIHATPLNFILFGGLNFQIEHHLFPQMPRINYFDVQPLVQDLCATEGVPYHEVSARRSFGEIYERLRAVALAERSHRRRISV